MYDFVSSFFFLRILELLFYCEIYHTCRKMHETSMHFCDSVIIMCEHLRGYHPGSQPAASYAFFHYYPFSV